jgi:serine/threonine protein kinase
MNYFKRHEIRRSPDWVLWRGEDTASRQLCTIKEINAEAAAIEQLQARLEEEYQFFAAVEHPHLLRPLQLEQGEGQGRILFEDTQCSLAQYLQAHGPLSPTLAANVLGQCAAALDHLHRAGIGHGAVSTVTILVGPAGEAKFGDFLGYPFAKAAVVPVPDYESKYQAPELIDSSLGACSPSSDLYCLGYAVLEMLLGEQFESLFGGDISANWLAWHADPAKELEDWRQALYRVPEGLLDILAALIEKDITRRTYKSAAQLEEDLERSRLTSGERLPRFQPGGPAPAPAAPSKPRTPKTASSSTRRRMKRSAIATASTAPAIALLPCTAGTSLPRHWFKPGRPILVGRNQDCDFQVPQASVSRKHAMLLAGDRGRWWIHDLGSRLGTRVNGARVEKSVLADGDEVVLGSARCRVFLGGAERASRRYLCGFALGKKIHEGANGNLYRATWVARDGREVALRVYPAEFQFDEVGIRRFMRGIPDAGLIRHDNVVRLYRGGFLRLRNGNTTWFLAMEYLPGRSLRDRLAQRGPLTPEEVIRFGIDITRALSQAAARDLVHRNITPSCVLFAADGTAKLGDFSLLRGGVQNALQEITMAAPVPGEHIYQPPEQLMSAGELGPACDLYALGATMYEALTGQPPFPRELSFMDLVQAICSEAPRPPCEVNPAVPAALSDLVMRALEKGPQQRFRTPALFRSALRSLVGD